MAISNPFLWGSAGRKMTPEQVARERERASAMLEGVGDVSPVGHWTQGLGRVVNAITGKIQDRRADASEQLGLDSADEYVASNPVLASLIGGSPITTFGGSDMPPLDRVEGDADGAFPASLVRTESGGNWGALNNEVGSGGARGHGGRLQFGQARLDDAANAGVIPKMSPQQFSQSPPEVQRAVERWHFADIDRAIDRGPAGAMIGGVLNGIPVTRNALRAVAHLGGTGGMNRFVESGGRYNPSDSFGTSLSDYAVTHGGSGGASAAPSAAQGQQAGVVEALAGAMANPWVAQKYGPVIQAIMDQQMRRGDMAYQSQLRQSDPMYQAQLAQLTNPQSSLPSTAQTLQWRAEQAGLTPGTPEYQQFMLAGGGGGSEESAAEAKIARLTNDLIESGDISDPQLARSMAVGITDGRFKLDRHPLEGTAQVVDMATGRVMYDGRNPTAPAPRVSPEAGAAAPDTSAQPSAETYTFGDEAVADRRDAGKAFGIEGFATTQINRLTDTLGLGQAYPDVAGTKADFDVLRERLISDIASAYGRQPPSWLLRNISDLSPSAGSPFQGAEDAQNKLNAIIRSFDQEIATTRGQLDKSLSPTTRQELELRLSTLEASKERAQGALGWFRTDDPSPVGGVSMDGWTVEEVN